MPPHPKVIEIKRIMAYLLIIFMLSACMAPDSQATPTGATRLSPSLTVPLTSTPREDALATKSATSEIRQESVKTIQVIFRFRDSVQISPEVEAGSTIVLEMRAEPVIQSIVRRDDGTIYSVSTQPWPDAPVRQMRLCLSQDVPCSGPGEMRPFETRYATEVKVDWLGPRRFNQTTEFFDANGAPLTSERNDASEPHLLTESTLLISSVLNPAIPLEKLPAPILTAAAATRSAFPLTGSVLIEGGRCCAGGIAGSQVNLKVEFQAASSGGKVVEMKAQPGSACIKDPTQLKAGWEPFQVIKTYSTSLAINWAGWYINVQYRDDQGNLSPVYCDDISLEGSPSLPVQKP